MRTLWILAIAAALAGCGPHYTIPNFETDEVEKVVSSGGSPQSCIENLKEDAGKLNVKVRLTDMSGLVINARKSAGFDLGPGGRIFCLISLAVSCFSEKYEFET